ncbi:MAG: hypothetical protein KAI66_14115, partial [Lentisphaeria bacterium]|nr:hypothetical protein [Lentisphaeria bacterium]
EPSGRSPVGLNDGWTIEEASKVMATELTALAEEGVALVLLLNAACYGDMAGSRELSKRAVSITRELLDQCGLQAVTTTSPFIACEIKKASLPVEVRASVNMRLGSIKAMEYLADSFDGYYLLREWNRCPEKIREIRAWCDERGKRLHALANSGCLRDCAFQSFHDNIVAHEAGVARQDNIPQQFPAPCWELVSQRENWRLVLQNTWLRPEDLHHVSGYFDTVKLATRLHSHPRRVIGAYARQSFRGNLLDLMEPGYGPLFQGCVIDNEKFPDDWFERTSTCGFQCHACDYCEQILACVLTRIMPPSDDDVGGGNAP